MILFDIMTEYWGQDPEEDGDDPAAPPADEVEAPPAAEASSFGQLLVSTKRLKLSIGKFARDLVHAACTQRQQLHERRDNPTARAGTS